MLTWYACVLLLNFVSTDSYVSVWSPGLMTSLQISGRKHNWRRACPLLRTRSCATAPSSYKSLSSDNPVLLKTCPGKGPHESPVQIMAKLSLQIFKDMTVTASFNHLRIEFELRLCDGWRWSKPLKFAQVTYFCNKKARRPWLHFVPGSLEKGSWKLHTYPSARTCLGNKSTGPQSWIHQIQS